MFWISTFFACSTDAVKPMLWRLGRAFHLIELTFLSLGKSTPFRRVRPSKFISPLSCSRSVAPMRLMLALAGATRLPLRTLMPPKEMSSVVPVAMAMLPEKVEQVATADASPAFWTVMVAEVLHSAVVAVLVNRSSAIGGVMRGRHTKGGASGGQCRQDKLHHGRHCGCNSKRAVNWEKKC